jgi:hypothetical protein
LQITAGDNTDINIGGKTMGDKYEVGQAGAVGPNAHAHDMTFQQIWSQSDIHLPTLAAELSQLRSAMRQEVNTPEHDIAIGQIAEAEAAAANGDGPKALEHLKKSGKWAFDVATKIGVGVATAALKTSLGI